MTAKGLKRVDRLLRAKIEEERQVPGPSCWSADRRG